MRISDWSSDVCSSDLAQTVVALPSPVLGHEEGRLRQVVLRRDGLHHRVRQPGLQRTDGRRVAGHGPVGVGLLLVDLDLGHASSLYRPQNAFSSSRSPSSRLSPLSVCSPLLIFPIASLSLTPFCL